jgi:hypothetical protein
MSLTTLLEPVPYNQVRIHDGFWFRRQHINATVTIPVIESHNVQSGRLQALQLNRSSDEDQPTPHIFWDSDIYKWIEAASYASVTHPDPERNAAVDRAIDLIGAAQQADGYINSYFTGVEPEKRWTNLRDWHELYCAGHLMEAAVAHFQATGNPRLLDIACRFADTIDRTFGAQAGKRRGVPGHEEIELALVKLFRVTGQSRYLKLATYFLDERGQQPHTFDLEQERHGVPLGAYAYNGYKFFQAHKPVRSQIEPVGHAVRAMYLYSAMVDVAMAGDDSDLFRTCERLWENLTRKRQYITGGIGSSARNEGFTTDYDLPNSTAYAETCAAVGLIQWAHRMLQVTGEGNYADILETTLYNAALAGVSLDGKRFFYVNPLESRGDHHRQEWFDCACCPANIARLIASVGHLFFSTSSNSLAVHLYADSTVTTNVGTNQVQMETHTRYPWSGDIRITVTPTEATEWTLALRLPGWCREADLRINDEPVEWRPSFKDGYIHLNKRWQGGDRIHYRLEMPVERIQSHPAILENRGRIALQRGPLVYCIEETDNPGPLADLEILSGADIRPSELHELEPELVSLDVEAVRHTTVAGDDGIPYAPHRCIAPVPVRCRAIPYYAWDNRDPGEMMIWLRHRCSTLDG